MTLQVENVKVFRNLKFCPRCASAKIRWASGLPQLCSLYDCQECGYWGPFVVEDENKDQKISDRWLKDKSETI